MLHNRAFIAICINALLAVATYAFLSFSAYDAAFFWSLVVFAVGILGSFLNQVFAALRAHRRRGIRVGDHMIHPILGGGEMFPDASSRRKQQARQEDDLPAEGLSLSWLQGPFASPEQRDASSIRLVLAPEYGFSRLAHDLHRLGVTLQSNSDEQAEPSAVTWSDERNTLIYHHESSLGLQRLELCGRDAQKMRKWLLHDCYLPMLQSYHLYDMLRSRKRQHILCALGAVLFLCRPNDHHELVRTQVDALCKYEDPAIAALAREVLALIA